MADWTPKLTRGLWGLAQRSVRDGLRIADTRDAFRAVGEAPDAATLSHLYSRAVGGEAMVQREAGYRGRVDPDVYAARRPGAEHIADLPRGFRLAGKYRQVVRVSGISPATGQPSTAYVNVQFDRLLSRGEAVDLALASVVENCSPECLEDPEALYHATWRPG